MAAAAAAAEAAAAATAQPQATQMNTDRLLLGAVEVFMPLNWDFMHDMLGF